MTEHRQLAIVRDYQELIAALRARVLELGTTGESLDEVAGLPARYTMKLLAPSQIKMIGRTSMGPLLGALGLKLIVAEDTEALEKVRRRLTPTKSIAKSAVLSQAKRRKRHFSMFHENPEFARRMRQRGILALSPKRRSAIARKAARARWRKPKPAPAAFLRDDC